MDTAGVRKGVSAHDGLVGLDGHVHQTANQSRRRINLRGVDVRLDVYRFVTFQNHGNLFQACVTCALTNTVDSHLHLTGTRQHTVQRIGSSHSQVVVAMGRDDGIVYPVHMLLQIFYLLEVLLRQTISRGVWNVHHRSARLDDSLYHARQVLIVRTARILAVELHIVHKALGILRSRNRALQNLLAGGVELILDVLVARTNTRVYALVLSILQSLESHVDVMLNGTCQRTDGRPRHSL